MLWSISEWSPTNPTHHHLAEVWRDFFLQHSLWGPGKASRDKTHWSVGSPLWPSTLEFLTFKVVYTKPPAFCQLQFRFSIPVWRLLLKFSVLVNCDYLYPAVCLSSFRGSTLLWSHFSVESMKSWFFSFLSFLLIAWSDNSEFLYMPNWKSQINF